MNPCLFVWNYYHYAKEETGPGKKKWVFQMLPQKREILAMFRWRRWQWCCLFTGWHSEVHNIRFGWSCSCVGSVVAHTPTCEGHIWLLVVSTVFVWLALVIYRASSFPKFSCQHILKYRCNYQWKWLFYNNQIVRKTWIWLTNSKTLQDHEDNHSNYAITTQSHVL